jgi:segregation and condensation protein A
MPGEAYQIALTDIFEGPMDLLVHLIKKNEVDIYDIPIALITEQFLAYLEWMKSLDVDIAGDFLVMAATLTHIKSRMLLPARAGGGDADPEEEDPRNEIAAPLLEYLQMKSAAGQLADQPLLEADVFVRRSPQSDSEADGREETLQADLMDLLSAYQSLLDNLSSDEGLRITAEGTSVKEKMTEVIDQIREKGALPFEALLSGKPDRMEIIVTFLAVLEIVKLNMGRLVQAGPSGRLGLAYQASADAKLPQ